MTSRRNIEQRIQKKEQEIQELEMKIREARAYVQALQDVARYMPRDGDGAQEDTGGSRGSEAIRAGSLVYDAREAILAAGRALHVVDILKASGRDNTRKNRTGMSGSLAAYVRRNEIFTRPKPNTFGLIELNPAAANSKIGQPSGPPDDFGLDSDEMGDTDKTAA